jgi:hypothetical protein
MKRAGPAALSQRILPELARKSHAAPTYAMPGASRLPRAQTGYQDHLRMYCFRLPVLVSIRAAISRSDNLYGHEGGLHLSRDCR